MTPKIDKVLAHLVEMPNGFTYSSGVAHKMSRAVIWEIVSGKHTGIGECRFTTDLTEADRPALTPQACNGFKTLVDRLELASRMKGKPPTLLEALLPDLPREPDNELTVVREGLSIALYDLTGKLHGIPVHALLGGKRRSRVPGMPVIHTDSPGVMITRAQAWAKEGYRYLKLKPPLGIDECIEVLGGIRRTLGDDISIQMDTNQGYTVFKDAEAAIHAFEPFSIDIYEDILDAPLDQMAELRKRTGATMMFDFDASWPAVYDICRSGAADIINQHPNNQGGMATALQIAAVADTAGIPTAIGSSGRFGIQDAAFQTLSTIIGLSRPCEDIGFLPYYSGPAKGEYAFDREPSIIKTPYPIRNGVIHVPDTPGLGIEIDRAKLESMTVESVQL